MEKARVAYTNTIKESLSKMGSYNRVKQVELYEYKDKIWMYMANQNPRKEDFECVQIIK